MASVGGSLSIRASMGKKNHISMKLDTGKKECLRDMGEGYRIRLLQRVCFTRSNASSQRINVMSQI